MTSTANVSVVIGSWGSYNECNERALGSNWINLCDYSDWDEIAEELKKQGFELDGIDEELFIQDIEGIDTSSKNWDYTNPEKFFNTLKESGIMDDAYKFQVFQAFLEVKGFSEWEELVENLGGDIKEIMPDVLHNTFIENAVKDKETFIIEVRKLLIKVLSFRDTCKQTKYSDVIFKAKKFIESL